MAAFPGGFHPLATSGVNLEVSGFLNGTGIIQSVNNVSDGAGGFTETWSPVASGTVACRVYPMTFAQIETVGLAEGIKVQYTVILPATAPISIGNRVAVIASNGGTTAYNVRWMQPQVSDIAFVKTLCSVDY